MPAFVSESKPKNKNTKKKRPSRHPVKVFNGLMARLDKKKNRRRKNKLWWYPHCGLAAVSRFFFFSFGPFFENLLFWFQTTRHHHHRQERRKKRKWLLKKFLTILSCAFAYLFFSSSWDFFFRWDFCLILSRFGLSMSIVVAFRQQLSLSFFGVGFSMSIWQWPTPAC